MLEELTIRNFAIIEELTVSFSSGMTVLTGETGAGKSIIIDALGLLAGGRSSVEFVRHSSEKAEIEGLFTVSEEHPSRMRMREAGIECEDGMIVLRREISHKGKSVCRVNGRLVTLATMRSIGQLLVDIHGQHEHQELLQMDKHSGMVDDFAGPTLLEIKEKYEHSFHAYKQVKNSLENLRDNDRENVQRLDLIQHQLHEIENASLQTDEDETLEQERYKLAHQEKLYALLQHTYEALYGDGKGLEWLREAMTKMEEAQTIDRELAPVSEEIGNSFYAIEEAAFAVRDHRDGIDFDLGRLQLIESRLDEINQLKRKYGSTISDILAHAEQINLEQDELLHRDERIQEYERNMKLHANDVLNLAEQLTEARKLAAERLAAAVEEELADLFMEKTKFSVRFQPPTRGEYVRGSERESWVTIEGEERLEFFLSANAGEPMKPLAKIASGGEISRIMLALKRILSSTAERTALIFDEVDTGVSGRVAQAIGEKIASISENAQVLCITHLPQVATLADTHLYIAKAGEERVQTSVLLLEEDMRVEEIARMLSGMEVTEKTLESAREMLEFSRSLPDDNQQ